MNKDINEVHEMFTDLNELVNEQQADIDTLEDNIEQTRDNVEAGTKEVIKAEGYQKKKRKRMCQFLGLLVVLGGIVALIVGVTSK